MGKNCTWCNSMHVIEPGNSPRVRCDKGHFAERSVADSNDYNELRDIANNCEDYKEMETNEQVS